VRQTQTHHSTRPLQLIKVPCKSCGRQKYSAAATGLCADCRGRELVGAATWERALGYYREAGVW
jgi:hypothetical protein